jgi:hypothetical protein
VQNGTSGQQAISSGDPLRFARRLAQDAGATPSGGVPVDGSQLPPLRMHLEYQLDNADVEYRELLRVRMLHR